MNKTIALFGANSAIAKATVLALLDRDESYGRIALVSRQSEESRSFASQLAATRSIEVDEIAADFSDIKSIQNALSNCLSFLNQIDLAIVCYGYLPQGSPLDMSSEDLDRNAMINYTSKTLILQHIATHQCSRRQGQIVVVSSVAGDRGRPSNYPYGSAYAALSAFADGLRLELRKSGVFLTLVKPGLVATPMTSSLKAGPLTASSSAAGAAIADAILKRKRTVYVPGFWRLIMAIVRALPDFVARKL